MRTGLDRVHPSDSRDLPFSLLAVRANRLCAHVVVAVDGEELPGTSNMYAKGPGSGCAHPASSLPLTQAGKV